MKVVQLTGKQQLTVQEAPTPVGDGNRPVMKVEAAGICGSDLHYWHDGDPNGLIMGHEFSGSIVDPGSRKDLKEGDRVVCLSVAPCLECENCKSGFTQACSNKLAAPGIIEAIPDRIGGYAEYFQPHKPEYLYKLPDTMTFEEAALTEPATVAYHTATLGGVTKGSKVLVTGAGLIGAMTIQWAKVLGAEKVYFTEVNEARAKKVMDMGYADGWVNAVDGVPELLKQFDEAKVWQQQMGPATQIQQKLGVFPGFDIVLECSGHPSSMNLATAIIHNFGTIVWAGITNYPVSLQHSMAIMRSATIKAFLGFSIHEYETAFKAIGDGSFPVKQYQSGSCTMATTQEAFEKLAAPGNALFKIIIYPHKEKV